MPAYDMYCFDCDEIFEVRRSITDDSALACSKCEGSKVRQVFMEMPATLVRTIDHPDSPLDDLPNAPAMRAQADMAIRKAMKDMGMNP